MIPFSSKRIRGLMLFGSLLLGLIFSFLVETLIFADRPFAGAGRECSDNRKGSGPARRDCHWRNSQ